MTITDKKLEHLNERCQRLEKAFAELPRIAELVAKLWEHYPPGCSAPEKKSVAACELCDRVGTGDTLYWWATVSLARRDPKRLDEKMTHRELHFCDQCWETSEVWEDLIKRLGWLKNV